MKVKDEYLDRVEFYIRKWKLLFRIETGPPFESQNSSSNIALNRTRENKSKPSWGKFVNSLTFEELKELEDLKIKFPEISLFFDSDL